MLKENSTLNKKVRKHNVSMISWKLYRITKNSAYIQKNRQNEDAVLKTGEDGSRSGSLIMNQEA